MSSEEERLVIEKDQKEFPECSYGTSMTQRSSSSSSSFDDDEDNKMTCETIRRIFRQCPGKANVDIYVKKETSNQPVPIPSVFSSEFTAEISNAMSSIDRVVKPLAPAFMSLFEVNEEAHTTRAFSKPREKKDFKGPVDEV